MTGYRALALPGVMAGFILTLMGLAILFLAYFPAEQLPLSLRVLDLALNLPLWLGWGITLAGLLSYVWGQGLLQQADWSPFFAAFYFFHLGLYFSLQIGMFYFGGSFAPVTPLVADWLPTGTVEVVITSLPALAGFGLAYSILRSSTILAVYLEKYLPESKVKLVRPNLAAEVVEAYLTLVSNAREQYILRFKPGHERMRLSRYLEGEARQPQTVYFNPQKSEVYEHVSAPHAEIVYDGSSGIFYIADLNSRNGILVNDQPVQREPVQLPNGADVIIGGAHFRFAVKPENEVVPQNSAEPNARPLETPNLPTSQT